MPRVLALALAFSAFAFPSELSADLPEGLSTRPLLFGAEALPPLPDPVDFPFQLVLDDDGAESVFGFGGNTARPFLFFNRFSSPERILLTEIWVLFPAGTDVMVGDEIELLVYLDSDTDPANGAELLASSMENVQAVDGVTFSVYPITPLIVGSGEVLLGVVNRYFQTGVDAPPTEPAALDTTASQDRSYVAYWTSAPPPAPDIATAAGVVVLDGNISGNFMIRGFGIPVAIPTLSAASLAALTLLLIFAAWASLRCRRA